MTPDRQPTGFVTNEQTSSNPSQPITTRMTSENDDDSIKREGLKERLTSDITSLRTRGFGKPKAGDRSDLLKVAFLYAPRETTDTDRIGALVDTAIAKKYGGELLAHVARLAFGADLSMRGKDHKVRYKAAWRTYGTGTYSSFTTSTLPRISSDLAAQITTIYDDGKKRGWDVVTYESPAEVEDELSPPPEPEAAIPRLPDTPPETDAFSISNFWRQARPFWGVLFVMVVGIVAAAYVSYVYGFNLGEHTATSSTPGRGTVIDARTGKAVEHPKIDPPLEGERPQISPLRFCDLTSGESCKLPVDVTYYTEAKPFVANPGDEIEASFLLYAAGPRPVPYLRLEVNAGRNQGQTQTEMEGKVIWPTINGANEIYSPKQDALPKYGRNFQMVEAEGAALTGVAYVSGSTELIDSRSERLAVLPDGIMGRRGVYLTDLGKPAGCLCVGGQYVREVTFHFKVLDEKR
jgi:hypothetical protein